MNPEDISGLVEAVKPIIAWLDMLENDGVIGTDATQALDHPQITMGELRRIRKLVEKLQGTSA